MEKGEGILPPPDIEVRIEARDQGRFLNLEGKNSKGQAILDRLLNKPGLPGGPNL